ncbi:DUF4238 domain-containing protein [Leucobacter allii]|uniref:DUF4238 domain-containing protein n=1 Tax=Leucobacter allii TaxID=2932247 RepID=UPI001FD10E11|nr:DUF4238 domain-containing protein [Leucobacter allii]UOR02394.1 DUF4238 domain-containing protein [Leucobacter allii]
MKGFSAQEKRIEQLDLSNGRRRTIGIADAAVVRDFYTIILPDGTRSDAWEDWLGETENQTKPALKRAISMPQFRLTDGDRQDLAQWISLQLLRGTDLRRQMDELASFTLRAQVGMGGFAYLRYVISKGLNREFTAEEIEPIWRDITSSEGPRVVTSTEEHLQSLTRMQDRVVIEIINRSWSRIRFERRTLLVSDSPIVPVPGEGFDERGLSGSPTILVPLNRTTLLRLDKPGELGLENDRDSRPSTVLAQLHNALAITKSERFVYFHPDDDPLPPDVEIPRAPLPAFRVSGRVDFINRERPLENVLKQIAESEGERAGHLFANYKWPIPGYVLPPEISL